MSSLLFTGSSGMRIGDIVNDVSLPVGVYLSPIEPLLTVPPGWYTVTNRFNGTAVVVCAWARRPWPIASNHGSAMAMLPAPLMTLRRLSLNDMVECLLYSAGR